MNARTIMEAVSAAPLSIVVPGQLVPMEFSRTDERGFAYASFFVRRESRSAGWFIYGRRLNVSANVVRICARPSRAARRTGNSNVKTRRGWSTRREAQAALDALSIFLSE